MKKTLLAIVTASALALTSCSQATNPNSPGLKEQIEAKVSAELEKRLKSPLEGKEAYEIEPGNYFVFFEDNKSSSEPFKDINIETGRAYLRRTSEPQNEFKTPLKLTTDSMGRYQLPFGNYEIWIQNQGVYAPIDEIDFEKRLKEVGEDWNSYRKGNIILAKKGKEEVVPMPEAPAPTTN